jgi:site-specific DNA-methyltransferase (adenine-specific)
VDRHRRHPPRHRPDRETPARRLPQGRLHHPRRARGYLGRPRPRPPGREDGRYYFEFEKWALSLIAAQPGNQSKRGADKGIDGNIYFDRTKRAIVSVKAGDNVSVAMIRDLRGVIEREGAEIGIFLTLTPPKQTMIAEAAAAGQFEVEGFAPVPRIQIVTVEEAMALRDRAVRLPLRRDDAFRKAAREEDRGAQGALDL